MTELEQAKVDKVAQVVNEIVQVDVFDKIGSEVNEPASYVRPALRHTKFENMTAPVSQKKKAAVAV